MTRAARRRGVAMVAHSYYEEDPRVRREAEALVARGIPVDVFALRRDGHAADDELAGVRIRRLDVRRHQGAGIATYLAEYLAFLVRVAFALAAAHRRRPFALVHVHTLPDFLVFAALPLRLAGVPVVLDLHEAMPEFYRSRFRGRGASLAYRALLLQERVAIRFADLAITVNPALVDRLRALGVPRHKVALVPNVPVLTRFAPDQYPARPFMADGVLRLVYAGALSPIYELDVVLRAVQRLRHLRPGVPVRLDLYGRDYGEVPLDSLARELGIAADVVAHGRIPVDEVPGAIASADIGLAPTRRSSFTDFSLSTKLYEYAAMGKPVVATELPLVARTFDGLVTTYPSGDADALALAIARLIDDPDRESRVRRLRARVSEMGWERVADDFVALVEGLVRR